MAETNENVTVKLSESKTVSLHGGNFNVISYEKQNHDLVINLESGHALIIEDFFQPLRFDFLLATDNDGQLKLQIGDETINPADFINAVFNTLASTVSEINIDEFNLESITLRLDDIEKPDFLHVFSRELNSETLTNILAVVNNSENELIIILTENTLNSPPTATDNFVTISEDSPVITGNFLTDGIPDSDPDGDPLTPSIIGPAPPGIVTFFPNGDFEYLAQNVQTLGPMETRDDQFTYQIDDGRGGTDTATVTITIQGQDDPVEAVDDPFTLLQGTTFTGNVLTNDTIIDGAPATNIVRMVTFAGQMVPFGTPFLLGNGTLTINTDGSFTYEAPTNVNATVSDSFTYFIEDSNGDTANAVLNFNTFNFSPSAVEILINESDQPDTVTVDNNPGFPTEFFESGQRPFKASLDGTFAPIFMAMPSVLFASLFNDIITGDAGNNSLDGFAGDDVIIGDFKQSGITIDENTTMPVSFTITADNDLVGGDGSDKVVGNVGIFDTVVTTPDDVTEFPQENLNRINDKSISEQFTVLINSDGVNSTADNLLIDNGLITTDMNKFFGNVELFNHTVVSGDGVAAPSNTVFFAAFGSTFTNNVLADASIELNMSKIAFGNDDFSSTHGTDMMFGDVGEFNTALVAGDNALSTSFQIFSAMGTFDFQTRAINISHVADASIENNVDIVFGNDIDLNSLFGQDTFVGDVGTFRTQLTGSSGARLQRVTLQQTDFLIGPQNLTTTQQTVTNIEQKIDLSISNNETVTTGSEIGIGTLFEADNSYGDMDKFTIDLQGGMLLANDGVTSSVQNYNPFEQPLFGGRADINQMLDASLTNNSTYNFGMDTFNNGEGNDHVAGDVGTLNLNLIGTSDVTTGGIIAFGRSFVDSSVDGSATDSSTFNFGDDTSIDLGADDDVAAGDVKMLALNLTGGSNAITGSVSQYVTELIEIRDQPSDPTPNFDVSKSLHVVTENNYTNLRPEVHKVTNKVDVSSSFTGAANFGNDGASDFLGGSGNDIISGDVESFTVTLRGGSNLQTGSVRQAPSIQKTIVGGGAQNNQATNTSSNRETVSSVLAQAEIDQSQFNFGSEINLSGGLGDDNLFGDVMTMNFDLRGGSNVKINSLQYSFPIARGFRSTSNIAIDSIAMTNTITSLANGSAKVTNSDFNFADDTINGGLGSDKIVGDVSTLDFLLQAGANVAAAIGFFGGEVNSFNTLAHIVNGMHFADGTAHLRDSNFNFGNDTLQGDTKLGMNPDFEIDTIFGDVEKISLNLTGGTANEGNSFTSQSSSLDFTLQQIADARAYLENVNFNLGNDNISDLFGNNNKLYGDMHEFSVGLTDGVGTGPGVGSADAELNNVALNSGDDSISGGINSDMMAGDTLVFSATVNGVMSPNSLDALNTLRAEGLVVNWGDDMLTGGMGADEAIFALDDPMANGKVAMQGVDIFTDFEIGIDKLVFGNMQEINAIGAIDARDLDTTTVFMDAPGAGGGGGALAMIFYDHTLLAPPAAITGDGNISGAGSSAALVTAINNNAATQGAVILEGFSTAAIPDFLFLELNGSLTVHSDMSFL